MASQTLHPDSSLQDGWPTHDLAGTTTAVLPSATGGRACMLEAPASLPQPETQPKSDRLEGHLSIESRCASQAPEQAHSQVAARTGVLSAVQEVDLLLLQWDLACLKLEKAEADFERSQQKRRPTFRMRCCGCTGETASSSASGGHAALLRRLINHVLHGMVLLSTQGHPVPACQATRVPPGLFISQASPAPSARSGAANQCLCSTDQALIAGPAGLMMLV